MEAPTPNRLKAFSLISRSKNWCNARGVEPLRFRLCKLCGQIYLTALHHSRFTFTIDITYLSYPTIRPDLRAFRDQAPHSQTTAENWAKGRCSTKMKRAKSQILENVRFAGLVEGNPKSRYRLRSRVEKETSQAGQVPALNRQG